MKTPGEVVKKALPYLLIGGVALGAAACGNGKDYGHSARHASPLKAKIHLPPNPPDVLVDDYTNGERTITFRTTHPLLSLEVTELCDANGTLIETTDRVLKTDAHSYTAEHSMLTQTHSKLCVGNQVALSSLHDIPTPLPYPDHQNSIPQSQVIPTQTV